jgi:hypothetical protein
MNAKQNLKETVFGTPTRFSNNFEACHLAFATPLFFHSAMPQYGGEDAVDAWGVTNTFPIGTPGPFPVHTPEKVVIKDFAHWDQYVKFPSLDFPEEEWERLIKAYEEMPTDQAYCPAFVAPGIFERLHHLGGIDNTLIALYDAPDEVHELIKRVTDWEMRMAEDICAKIHPNSVFHHDDWGSLNGTFMSVGMFEEFFLDSYKQIYGYYHDHGCELVFHHSDSYAATLVPDMIEMGVNVFQGATSTNNIPELVKKYGDKITIMGGFDGRLVDKDGMTKEEIKKIVYDTLDAVGTPKGFIPCSAQGGPGSIYENVYRYLCECVDEYNMEKLGATQEEINDRAPLQQL